MIMEIAHAFIWLTCAITGYILGKEIAKGIDNVIKAYIHGRYILYKISSFYELLRVISHSITKE